MHSYEFKVFLKWYPFVSQALFKGFVSLLKTCFIRLTSFVKCDLSFFKAHFENESYMLFVKGPRSLLMLCFSKISLYIFLENKYMMLYPL